MYQDITLHYKLAKGLKFEMKLSMTCWTKKLVNYSPSQIHTLPETNMAPENGWLEDEFPFGKAYLQGRAVSFREGICFESWDVIAAVKGFKKLKSPMSPT